MIEIFPPSRLLPHRACSLAVLIESLGCGTLPWRREMEKGEGHGVRLACDAGDSDMIVTMDTVSLGSLR